MLWTVVFVCVFGFGFDNISQAVADYYKYDKITNIERVYQVNVIFPAITICTRGRYWREHYRNGLLIKKDKVILNLIKNFVDFKQSYSSFKNKTHLNLNNHLDIFKNNDSDESSFRDCLRLYAVTNRSVELLKASSIDDRLRIYLNSSSNLELISKTEYYRYTLHENDNYLVYVGDNSLNSIVNLQYLEIDPGGFYNIEIEKESIESKLPEPYNSCKETSVDVPYHQMDCLEACVYKEIKNKYNCTFQGTLFSIQGYRECVRYYKVLKDEFSARCLSECPLENCFSEKFTLDATKTGDGGLTVFRFYFGEFSTLNITQIPKTDTFTFLNNVGGGLGLFMGIAFPNLIEFFQFILEIILIFFIKKIN